MKCSKPRFAFRPFLEKLESRLQPGSVITGSGYGWSLLADKLSILDQGSLDSQSLIPQSSSESSKPSAINTSADAHSDNLEIAVASVAAARSSSLPNNNLANNLAADLTNDGLSSLSLTGHSNSVPPAALATPVIGQPAPATPIGSVPQSQIGVANPAQPAASLGLANPSTPVNSAFSGHRAVPAQEIKADTPAVRHLTGLQTTNILHLVPFTIANPLPEPGGAAGNQATINFLTYLGGSGPDSINSVAVRNENGTNFIYVAGSFTDANGRTDAFAAKLAGDGSSVVWTAAFMVPSMAGPDRASGLALSGDNVYVAGSIADPASTPQTDGFVLQLDANSGALGPQGNLPDASFAAITTDSSGNVYVAGSVADPGDSNRLDLAFMQLNSDLTAGNYSVFAALADAAGNAANSFFSTGGALIVDAQGNAYFAGTLGVVGDPNNETFPLYGRLNAAGTAFDWGFYLPNPTPGSGGIGTALAFDPSGNVVFTGSVNDSNTTAAPTKLNQDLVLGRADRTTGTLLDQDANGNPIFVEWIVDDRSGAPNRVGDWAGSGLAVLPDGSSIVTGATFDPAAPNNPPLSRPSNGIDVHVTHFGADDQSTTQNTDGDPENTFGGSGADFGNAVALDPTTSNSPFTVYVVGSTNSTDLPTTAGVVQQTYNGTSTTGFVGQASVV